jgi:hypothetical protein
MHVRESSIARLALLLQLLDEQLDETKLFFAISRGAQEPLVAFDVLPSNRFFRGTDLPMHQSEAGRYCRTRAIASSNV